MAVGFNPASFCYLSYAIQPIKMSKSTPSTLSQADAAIIAQWFGLTLEEFMSPQSIQILPKWSHEPA